jgi:hypothetical protein
LQIKRELKGYRKELLKKGEEVELDKLKLRNQWRIKPCTAESMSKI